MHSKILIYVVVLLALNITLCGEVFAKSYWKRGMAIGAGAVALGLPLGISAAATKCDSSETDLQICGDKWGPYWGLQAPSAAL